MSSAPVGIIPDLIAIPEDLTAPSFPIGANPAPIGFVGFIDPKSAPELDTSDLPDGKLVRLWSIEDPTVVITRPPVYRLKPTHQELIEKIPGKVVDRLMPWQQKNDIDEVIRQVKEFRFDGFVSQTPITEEEAEWLLATHPYLERDTLPTWARCHFFETNQCTFAAKNDKVLRRHHRVSHGGG